MDDYILERKHERYDRGWKIRLATCGPSQGKPKEEEEAMFTRFQLSEIDD